MNYDHDLQILLINMMLVEPELYARSANILEPLYFDKKLSPVINFIHQYAEKHNGLPNTKIINAQYKTNFEDLETLNESHKDWYFETVEEFCKKKAMEHAIIKGSEHLEKGNYGEIDKLIKDASLISLQRDMGTNYFSNPRERLEKLQTMNGNLSTGWTNLDKIIYNIGFGELILFTAISGGGKSVAMQNITLNFALMGLNVVYVTLELSEELVAKRLDAMLTGIPNAQIYKNLDDVELKVKMTGKTAGKIFIKYMDPGCTPNDLKAYIREFTIQNGIKPDALVIDYMDLMSPNEKRVDAGNFFVKDKLIAESLRSLGSPQNFNMVTVSAAQINRCLTLDTMVEKDSGELVRIDSLKVGDKITSDIGFVEVTDVHPVVEQDVYRITTKSGKVIECSAKHEFPVGDELKSILSGMKPGDKLKIS